MPNPDLEPETVETYEFNLTYTLSDLFASISFYYNEQDKILIHADDGLDFQLLHDITGSVADPVYRNLDLTDPAGVSRTVNAGQSTTTGIDLYRVRGAQAPSAHRTVRTVTTMLHID